MKAVNKKLLKLLFTFAAAFSIFVAYDTVNAPTVSASYVTVSQGGLYTVHDMVAYVKGSDMKKFFVGHFQAVVNGGRKAVLRKYGKIENRTYKIVYDTSTWQKNVWTTTGNVSNFRAYK